MQTQNNLPERRSERTSTRSGAIFLLLDAIVEKSNVQAIALTNEAGFVVASTRGRCDASRLANAGLSVLRGENADELDDLTTDPLSGSVGGVDVFAHPVLLNGAPYALVSMGARIPHLRETTSSLARILAPRS
jgi:hypothetical protein